VQARRFKMTPMIGRSHGVHAEPITFGLKLALMFDEFGRAEERLAQTRERIRVGKLSGAVGTHAHLDPKIERSVCEKLGLKPATLSTQIVQRDRHAQFVTTLALAGASLDLYQDVRRGDAVLVRLAFQIACLGQSGRPQRLPPVLRSALASLNDTTRMVSAHAR